MPLVCFVERKTIVKFISHISCFPTTSTHCIELRVKLLWDAENSFFQPQDWSLEVCIVFYAKEILLYEFLCWRFSFLNVLPLWRCLKRSSTRSYQSFKYHRSFPYFCRIYSNRKRKRAKFIKIKKFCRHRMIFEVFLK
jgi:hypothetical protein